MSRPTKADFLRDTAAACWLGNTLQRPEECIAGAAELARHLPPECFEDDLGAQLAEKEHRIEALERDRCEHWAAEASANETIEAQRLRIEELERQADELDSLVETLDRVQRILCPDPKQSFVDIVDAAVRTMDALSERDRRIAELEAGASAVTATVTKAYEARLAELEATDRALREQIGLRDKHIADLGGWEHGLDRKRQLADLRRQVDARDKHVAELSDRLTESHVREREIRDWMGETLGEAQPAGLLTAMKRAVQLAVEAEREACAKAVEAACRGDLARDGTSSCGALAAERIRARRVARSEGAQ